MGILGVPVVNHTFWNLPPKSMYSILEVKGMCRFFAFKSREFFFHSTVSKVILNYVLLTCNVQKYNIGTFFSI